MRLTELLKIPRGVTAIIGGGGKTTLMYTLAKEIMQMDKVIVCTTTQILQPDKIPVMSDTDEEVLNFWINKYRCVCLGSFLGNGKLGIPEISMDRISGLASYVITEADGSKGLPLKAHESWEPVIPKEAKNVILTLGIKGMERPIKEVAHRPQLYAKLVGCSENDIVTPHIAAKVINTENYHSVVFINQVETEEELKAAKAIARELECPVYGGALQRGEWQCLQL